MNNCTGNEVITTLREKGDSSIKTASLYSAEHSGLHAELVTLFLFSLVLTDIAYFAKILSSFYRLNWFKTSQIAICKIRVIFAACLYQMPINRT